MLCFSKIPSRIIFSSFSAFCFPRRAPFNKAIAEKYYTGLLGYTASISDKVTRKEYIEKVMRICHREAQIPSKYDLAEATEYTEAVSGKVAYKRIKEKVSGNCFSYLQ